MHIRNFFRGNKTGQALAPQTVNGATVNGATITTPWIYGDQLTFLVEFGAFAASCAGALVVQAQKISDDSWETLTGEGGNVQWDATKLVDGASGYESSHRRGTIPFGRVDAETYKALRLSFTESGSQNMTLGASYVISGLDRNDNTAVDDLYSILRPAQ